MMFLCTFMCLFLFTFELTQLGGQVMFFVWVCAFYFSFCGNYSMMPACVSRTFGASRVGINYSVVFTSQVTVFVVFYANGNSIFNQTTWQQSFKELRPLSLKFAKTNLRKAIPRAVVLLVQNRSTRKPVYSRFESFSLLGFVSINQKAKPHSFKELRPLSQNIVSHFP